MILSRRAGSLRLVEQVEHGRVAGELAAAWGSDVFEAPAPRESVRFAAARHDEGWRAWDARVLFNELERRPLHFLEIDPAEHVRLYRRGVETVSLGDVYAGVLVGMHWTGLYRGRWSAPGLRGRLGPDGDGARLQDEVVDAEERRWIAAKRGAWCADEPRSAFECRLWHNYELLQLWDLLSLYLAVMPPEADSGDAGRPPRWGPQLSALDHAPQTVLLPEVRSDPFGPQHTIRVGVRSGGVVVLDPYPFERPGITVDVVQRVIADRAYTPAEMETHVRKAPESVTTWRMEPWRTA